MTGRRTLARRFRNPFYVGVVVTAILFCLTAFAFVVLTIHDLRSADPATVSSGGRWLLEVLDQYGFRVMMFELAVLAVFCVAAMATDQAWEMGDR